MDLGFAGRLASRLRHSRRGPARMLQNNPLGIEWRFGRAQALSLWGPPHARASREMAVLAVHLCGSRVCGHTAGLRKCGPLGSCELLGIKGQRTRIFQPKILQINCWKCKCQRPENSELSKLLSSGKVSTAEAITTQRFDGMTTLMVFRTRRRAASFMNRPRPAVAKFTENAVSQTAHPNHNVSNIKISTDIYGFGKWMKSETRWGWRRTKRAAVLRWYESNKHTIVHGRVVVGSLSILWACIRSPASESDCFHAAESKNVWEHLREHLWDGWLRM